MGSGRYLEFCECSSFWGSVVNQPRIIIIGGGVAGMMAATRLAEQNIPVRIVSDGSLGLSDAMMATGGLAAAVDVKGEGDSFEKHFEDTIRAGDYLANQELPRQMCLFAPELAGLLDRMGVLFARSETFSLDGRRLSGHRFQRLLFAETGIGGQVVSALRRQVQRFVASEMIAVYEGLEFLSLVRTKDGKCGGLVAMDHKTMELVSFSCAAVILATGGFGRLFKNSTQAINNTGSAISILYQQGVPLANMEFIQSHPTTLPGPDKSKLISESLHSTGVTVVPVPAVHATLGGLWTDDDHSTNIPGVLAAGDCIFQYHGAKRMAGNGLTASLYGGLKAARSALRYLSGWSEGDSSALLQNEIKRQHSFNQELMDLTGSENGHQIYEELSHEMNENFLGVRQNKKLAELDKKIEELKVRFQKMTLFDRGTFANRELVFARRLKNMLELACVVTRSAWARNETRGVHVKSDFPMRDDERFLKTTKAWATPDGPRIEYEDVTMKYLSPLKN